jgi:hypothetical protein
MTSYNVRSMDHGRVRAGDRNFIPRTAMGFYRALIAGDDATVRELLDVFFLP